MWWGQGREDSCSDKRTHLPSYVQSARLRNWAQPSPVSLMFEEKQWGSSTAFYTRSTASMELLHLKRKWCPEQEACAGQVCAEAELGTKPDENPQACSLS